MRRRALLALWLSLLVAPTAGCRGGEEGRPPDGDEIVVLLHGLGRTSRSMEPLAQALSARGWRVESFDYPSTREPVDALAGRLELFLTRCCKTPGVRVHFVTHSLGGIILRYYLATRTLPGLGRVVMLSPPSGGSELIDALGELGIEPVAGPTGERLGTDPNSLPRRLPPVDFELGVITGDVSFHPFLSQLIPGPDDGRVSVESARTAGMADFLVVPHSHTFIMGSEEAIEQTDAFLREGAFRRDDPAEGAEEESSE